MKKIIRIILSPLVFLLWFMILCIIPIGIITLVIGVLSFLVGALRENYNHFTNDDLIMTFTLFIYPFEAAKQFIKYGTLVPK